MIVFDLVIKGGTVVDGTGAPAGAALLERYDFSSLATIALSGAPVPPNLVARIDTRGASSSNSYGLTETTGGGHVEHG